MNRTEYISQLRSYLEKSGLPREERENAIQYYEELFYEAGLDKEDEIAKELGDPVELAKQILRDNNIHPEETEFFPGENQQNNQQSNQENYYKNDSQENYTQYNNARKVNTNFSNNTDSSAVSKIVLLVVVLLFLSPVIIPLGGVVLAIAAVLFALVCVGFFLGIAAIIGGIALLFTIAPLGVILMGGGLVISGLFGLILFPFVKGAFNLVVKIFNWIVNCIRRLIGIRSVA